MKIFKLPKLAEAAADGSFCLSAGDTGSNAVYLTYSRLAPGEAPKSAAPARGAEEIILVVKGNVRVRCGRTDFVIGPGEAFHSKGGDTFQMENIGSDEAVYVAAGGRAGKAQAAEQADAEPKPAPSPEPEAPEKKEDEPEFVITRED